MWPRLDAKNGRHINAVLLSLNGALLDADLEMDQ